MAVLVKMPEQENAVLTSSHNHIEIKINLHNNQQWELPEV